MDANQVLVKMVSDRWYGNMKNFNAALDAISDEKLLQEIAPGRNRGIYLLGHLLAVHDDMLPLLELGDKQYSALNKIFIEAPDKTIAEIPAAAELRSYWRAQSELLQQKFESMQPATWLEKHNAVSAEDFLKEPHRNKLNILLTRTTHLSYHTGQMVLLK